MNFITKDNFKKRLTIALGLLLVGVLSIVFLWKPWTGADKEVWQRGLFCILAFGSLLASFLYFLFGAVGFAEGYGLVLVVALMNGLPKPYNSYAALLYITLLLAVPPLLKYRGQRKAHKEPTERKPQEPQPEGQSSGAESVCVFLPISGYRYQIFRKGGRLLLYRSGGELSGIDPKKLQQPDALRPLGKKDLELPIDETFCVKLQEKQDVLHVRLKAAKKTLRMVADGNTDDDALRAFFERYATEPQRIEQPQTAPDPQRKKYIAGAVIGLLIFTAVVDLPWLFLPVPYKLFACLSLLPTLAGAALYCLFPNETTMNEKTKKDNGKSSLLLLLTAPSIVPLLRVTKDFTFSSWGRLLLFAATVTVLLTIVVLLCNKEWKRSKGILLLVPLLLLFYSVGAAAQVNYIADAGKPVPTAGVVEKTHSGKEQNSAERAYYIDIRTEDGDRWEIQTDEEHFPEFSEGDEVTVDIAEGALGISYVFYR